MDTEKGKLIQSEKPKAESGGSSFAALLRQEGDEIRRDVYMLINPEQSASGRIQSGITIVYPGCRTKGHAHPDRLFQPALSKYVCVANVNARRTQKILDI